MNKQQQHYNSINDIYRNHYYDSTAMRYRKKFLFDFLFKDINFNDLKIADIASGAGHNSLSIIKKFPNAKTVGFDISDKACAEYRENTGNESIKVDLTEQQDFKQEFDIVIVIGGLHHCVSNLKQTMNNINNMLKPGGYLLMMEPNKQYVLESVRKFWYKKDKYFESSTEEALNHDEILSLAGPNIKLDKVNYLGGPAYFLIFNSMIFRIPIGIKKFIAPPLFFLERVYNYIPIKLFHPIFISRLIKETD